MNQRCRRSFNLIAMVMAAAFCFSAGCSRRWADPPPNAASEITVAAAANLTDVFGEIAKSFTAQTGIRVTFSFGATADLAKQIENGGPFDVFAAADVDHVDDLVNKTLLVRETRAVYA